jgi:hypothetical protein
MIFLIFIIGIAPVISQVVKRNKHKNIIGKGTGEGGAAGGRVGGQSL